MLNHQTRVWLPRMIPVLGLAGLLVAPSLGACTPEPPPHSPEPADRLAEQPPAARPGLPAPEITPADSPLAVDPGKIVTLRAFSEGADIYEWQLQGAGTLTSSTSPVAVYTAPEKGGATAVLTVRARNDSGVSPASVIVVNVKSIAAVPLGALGIPAGWMSGGDHPKDYLGIGTGKECRPGTPCYEFSYKPGGGWGGIYWWPVSCGKKGDDPAWEKFKTGACAVSVPAMGGIADVKRLTFWARGAHGGEVVEFKVGGPDILPIPGRSTGTLTLEPAWKRYEIDLANVDLTKTAGLFVWIATDLANPRGAVFFLQDVQFEGLK